MTTWWKGILELLAINDTGLVTLSTVVNTSFRFALHKALYLAFGEKKVRLFSIPKYISK